MEIIILLSIGIFVYAVVYSLFYVLGKDKILIEDRLDKLVAKSKDEKLEKKNHKKNKVKKRILNFSFSENKIKSNLQSAGIIMKPEEFILAWTGTTMIIPLFLILMGANYVIVGTAGIIGFFIPLIIVERAKNKRLEIFSSQLGESLMVMGNSLRAGFTFQQSMQNVHENMPDPLSYEFGKTLREINYGMPFEDAIKRLGHRMKNKDLDLLISAVIIQNKVGGNLAELMDIIGETIKDRVKIKRDIKTMTSSGRMSGIILGLLPIILALVLSIINPGYLGGFFTSDMGILMIAIAVIMEAIGFFIIWRMINIKF